MKKIFEEDFKLIMKSYSKTLDKLRNNKIYITGSYGMITSYLSLFLIYISDEYNLELYLQGRNQDKANEIFGPYLLKRNVHFITADFENNEFPTKSLDYIVHAASPASTSFFKDSPVDVISPNVIGTWNLLQFARKTGVKKILLCSSNSIYGEGVIKKTELTENDYGIVDPLNDRASYIESKRMAEQMCVAFWKQYDVPISIIRICHTYGPTFDIERDNRIIPKVIKQILHGEEITLYKDPDSVIQYTYIVDMISAILLVLVEGIIGEAYNAEGDEVISVDKLITMMVKSDTKITSKLIEKRIDDNYNFRKGNSINLIKLSNHKLKELGWRQLVTNKEGFSRIINNYIKFGGGHIKIK